MAMYDLSFRFTAGEDHLGTLQEISAADTTIHQGPIQVIPEPNVIILISILTPFLAWIRRRPRQFLSLKI